MPKKKEVLNLPLREIYIHNYIGKVQSVEVYVLIDYGKRKISIVDSESAVNADFGRKIEVKKYIFGNRERAYMMGWHDVLDGTKSAIDHADAKLKKYIEEDEERTLELLLEIEKAEK